MGKKRKDGAGSSYWPVLSLLVITLLMAGGAARIAEDQWVTVRTLDWFIAFTMSFSTMFPKNDVLARRWVPYSYIYPYAETGAGAGILMIATAELAVVPVALFIGTVGAASVAKAVWIDKRELKCACVGGNSNVHSASSTSPRTWPWPSG